MSVRPADVDIANAVSRLLRQQPRGTDQHSAIIPPMAHDNIHALLARIAELQDARTARHEASADLLAAQGELRDAILEACRPVMGALVPHPIRMEGWSILPGGKLEGSRLPSPDELAALLAERAAQAAGAKSEDHQRAMARAAALRAIAGMVKGLMSGK